jgi:hypothetical protein
MLCIFFSNVLNTKIVDDEAEGDRSSVMFEETMCELTLVVAVLFEMGY